jgi:hypothetical protein
MGPTELKMQPTIHQERKAEYGQRKSPALRSQSIVGCIFNSVGLFTSSDILCILRMLIIRQKKKLNSFSTVLTRF